MQIDFLLTDNHLLLGRGSGLWLNIKYLLKPQLVCKINVVSFLVSFERGRI